MVSPKQHRKAKMIYRAGIEPPHVCGTRCQNIAAQIATADQCQKCESHYELLYYNGQHLINRRHQPNCPDINAHLYARDVLGVVDGKVITAETDPRKPFECPWGCEIQMEHTPGDTIIRHQRDCPDWSDKPLQPR